VTVVDQHAKTLSGGETGMAAAADSRKSEVEQRIAKQVKSLVEGVVGAGNARVNVTADLDLARVTLQEEKFDPDGQVVRSESTTDENSRENDASGSGQASVAANIPGAGAPDLNANTSTSGRQESTTNYEISKTVRTEVQEPGTVKRLSVAVAVDGVSAPGKDGKPGAYTPRSAEEMQQIEQLVRTAVGYNADRGDQISVVNVRFPSPQVNEGVEAANPLMGFDKNDIMRAAELGVLAVVGVLMIFFVARPLLGAAGAAKGAKGGAAPPAVTRIMVTPDGQQMQLSGEAGGGALALPHPDGEARVDLARVDGQVRQSTVRKVAEFVDQHPEESVAILRSWLHETT
jgi:flagellar M-ring protein FliF